jgi:hypothetical protein
MENGQPYSARYYESLVKDGVPAAERRSALASDRRKFVAGNLNDDDPPIPWRGPQRLDAHEQAALFLIESLLHSLIARSVISVAEAVEIVEVAAEVKTDAAAEMGDTPGALQRSLDLLAAIGASLAIDAF